MRTLTPSRIASSPGEPLSQENCPLSRELVDQVLAREPQALGVFFDFVVQLLLPVVARVLVRRGGTREDRDDIHQQILAQLIGELDERLGKWVPDKGSLCIYLCMWARSRVLDILRRRRRVEPLPPADDFDGPTETVDVLHQLAGMQILSQVAAELDGENAQLFTLLRQDLTCEEIAEKLGFSSQRVHQRKRRLIIKMREIVRKLLC